ncbi:MAG: DUF1800 domain-containing protein [Agriterribacter sp.]
MSLSKQRANTHLLWRAGFGPSLQQLNEIRDTQSNNIFHALLKKSESSPVPYNIVDSDLVDMLNDPSMVNKMVRKNLGAEDRKMLREKNRDSIKQLNLRWLNDMVGNEDQLREKTALFWHGHFACRSLSAVYQQALLNAVRSNALGSFRELLFAVSKSAAMLNFLNNNQNRKNHPNENFAREVMELFTLGRGNYTEQDIKEAARAFTGWGADASGNFVFRERQHDDGAKTFLGKTGNFTGDDVLNILLEQKQTARFITQKIYRYFVNEQPDNEKTDKLAEKFYKSDYDITQLLKNIFTSDWFYDESNIAAKIKSPVELLAGLQRVLPMQIENENALLLLQRILGQVLLYPPNVAGWSGGKNWIDSSTLMMRMRIPKLLSDADILNVKPKDDDDQMMGKKDDESIILKRKGGGAAGKLIKATINWQAYTKYFDNIPKDQLVGTIINVLFSSPGTISVDLIKQYADITSREDFIKTATVRLMSLPEYQLC